MKKIKNALNKKELDNYFTPMINLFLKNMEDGYIYEHTYELMIMLLENNLIKLEKMPKKFFEMYGMKKDEIVLNMMAEYEYKFIKRYKN